MRPRLYGSCLSRWPLPPSFWLQICHIHATLRFFVLAFDSVEFSPSRLLKPSCWSSFSFQLKHPLFREAFLNHSAYRSSLFFITLPQFIIYSWYALSPDIFLFIFVFTSFTTQMEAPCKNSASLFLSSIFPVFTLVPAWVPRDLIDSATLPSNTHGR